MAKKYLLKLLESLPEECLMHAVQNYVFELEKKGELKVACAIYRDLLAQGCEGRFSAEICRSLIAALLAAGSVREAIRFYQNFPKSEIDEDSVLKEKLLACHMLGHRLCKIDAERSLELWREFSLYVLNPELRWHWCQTGLGLMIEWLLVGHSELANIVFRNMQKYGNCTETETLLAQASALLRNR